MTFSGHGEPSSQWRPGVLKDGSHSFTLRSSCKPRVLYCWKRVKHEELEGRGGEGVRQWGEAAVPNEKFTRLGVRKPECKTVPGTQQMFNSNKIMSTKKAEKFTFFLAKNKQNT